jgi:hypothetical protein
MAIHLFAFVGSQFEENPINILLVLDIAATVRTFARR